MDHKKTGKLIQTIRVEKGITRKELADKINVSNAAVSKWENGYGFPEISLLEPLAEVLNISVTELLHGERNPEEDGNGEESIVKDLIHLSKKEKHRNNVKQRFILIIGVVLFAILGWSWMRFLWKNQGELTFINGNSGVFLLIAIGLGFVAWILPITKILWGRKMKASLRSVLSTISFVCCSVSLWIPIFYMDMLARKEDTSAMLDTAWGFNLAAMLLLLVTIILNTIAYIVCLRKKSELENKVGNKNETEDN